MPCNVQEYLNHNKVIEKRLYFISIKCLRISGYTSCIYLWRKGKVEIWLVSILFSPPLFGNITGDINGV